MSPLKGVAACVNHPNPLQRITRYEALRLFTANGAFIGFEENRKGTLEIGKQADVVVLEDNPFTVPPNTIGDIPVKMTVVAGEVVFDSRG